MGKSKADVEKLCGACVIYQTEFFLLFCLIVSFYNLKPSTVIFSGVIMPFG